MLVRLFAQRRAYSSLAKPGPANRSLTQRLSEINNKHRPHGHFIGTEVVNEELCDDVVKYLAPTLEEYKGCTILDINPGAAVFSTALHDLLQPKCHILAEPEERFHEPFIKPLLEKPGSTYRHSTLALTHPHTYKTDYQTLFNDEILFEPKEPPSDDDPAFRRINRDLLVIGNLSRRHFLTGTGKLKPVDSAYLHLRISTFAALYNGLMHARGRVRTLWWVPESQKRIVFPVSEMWRTAYSASLSFCCDIDEAVGTRHLDEIMSHHKRPRMAWWLYLTEARTQEAMRKLGMERPPDRRYLNHEDIELTEDEQTPGEIVSPYKIVSFTADEIEEELQSAEAMLPSLKRQPRVRTKKAKQVKSALAFPQTLAMAVRRSVARRMAGGPEHMASHADLALRLIRIEASFKELEEKKTTDDAVLADLRKRILALGDAHAAVIQERGPQFAVALEGVVDPHAALLLEPALLPQERRRYETLLADKNDFWPSKPAPMMLIDILPNERDLSVPGLASASESRFNAQQIMKRLFVRRSDQLPKALEFLGPNAAQDLIPMVPAMTDARRGGRMNPMRLKVRMLTDQMWEDLVKAFTEWPFKQSMLGYELDSMLDDELLPEADRPAVEMATDGDEVALDDGDDDEALEGEEEDDDPDEGDDNLMEEDEEDDVDEALEADEEGASEYDEAPPKSKANGTSKVNTKAKPKAKPKAKARASPGKASPKKASGKASPAKASPAKASPGKASPAMASLAEKP